MTLRDFATFGNANLQLSCQQLAAQFSAISYKRMSWTFHRKLRAGHDRPSSCCVTRPTTNAGRVLCVCEPASPIRGHGPHLNVRFEYSHRFGRQSITSDLPPISGHSVSTGEQSAECATHYLRYELAWTIYYIEQ